MWCPPDTTPCKLLVLFPIRRKINSFAHLSLVLETRTQTTNLICHLPLGNDGLSVWDVAMAAHLPLLLPLPISGSAWPWPVNPESQLAPCCSSPPVARECKMQLTRLSQTLLKHHFPCLVLRFLCLIIERQLAQIHIILVWKTLVGLSVSPPPLHFITLLHQGRTY